MLFNHKRLFILVQVIFFAILLSSCDSLIEEPDQTSISVGNISRTINTNHVLLIGDCYVYQENDGIYKIGNTGKEKIFHTEENTYLAAYNDSIIIKPELSNEIYQIDLDGTILKQAVFGVCSSMYVMNDILFCSVDKELIVKAYDITNDFQEIMLNQNFYNNRFVIKKAHNDEEWFVYEDETYTILSTRTPHGSLAEVYFTIFQKDILQPVFHFGENADFYYQYDAKELLDFSVRHGAIIQYDIKPKRYSEFYLDLSLFYIDKENIAIEEQAIVSIVKTPFNSKIGCSPKLNKHMKDTLLIVDKEDKKVLHRIDTRQRERLLYADSSRAITY